MYTHSLLKIFGEINISTYNLSKLKFALIGCGRIAHRHAEIISSIGKLSAVCDIKNDLADLFAEKYNSVSFTDYTSLLKETDADVVAIATPNGLHAQQTVDSLNAGKHVICEKPMATNLKDCYEMIKAEKTSAKKLFVVKQNRFNPPVQALKKAIDDFRLGRIINVELNCFWNRSEDYYRTSEWKGKKSLDGGTLFTQFSHFIDLLYWLIGDVKNVYSISRNFLHKNLIEFEDTGVVSLEFQNGAIGSINYTVNSFNKNMEGSITVFGEKGTVKVGGQYLNVLEYQSIENFEITGLTESRPANDYGYYQGSMSNHEKVYENVLEVLNNGSEIAAGSEDGMKTVEIIERIYANSRENS